MEIIFKNLSMDILLGGSSFPLLPDRIGMWDFGVSGKPEDPEEEPRSKDKNQQQTQPHMWHQVREWLNPGHSGGRRALSPLCHSPLPSISVINSHFNWTCAQHEYKTNNFWFNLSIYNDFGETHCLFRYEFLKMGRFIK